MYMDKNAVNDPSSKLKCIGAKIKDKGLRASLWSHPKSFIILQSTTGYGMRLSFEGAWPIE